MLRIATIEDLPLVLDLGMKFANSSKYSKLADKNKIEQVAKDLLEADNNQKIVLLYEDYGMLAGLVTPFIFGTASCATELVWYVEPDKRGTKAGTALLEAFEFWAKAVGCSTITMVSIDDKVGKYYESKGYTLYERAYMKEI